MGELNGRGEKRRALPPRYEKTELYGYLDGKRAGSGCSLRVCMHLSCRPAYVARRNHSNIIGMCSVQIKCQKSYFAGSDEAARDDGPGGFDTPRAKAARGYSTTCGSILIT
jgi:hypothetical protein